MPSLSPHGTGNNPGQICRFEAEAASEQKEISTELPTLTRRRLGQFSGFGSTKFVRRRADAPTVFLNCCECVSRQIHATHNTSRCTGGSSPIALREYRKQ